MAMGSGVDRRYWNCRISLVNSIKSLRFTLKPLVFGWYRPISVMFATIRRQIRFVKSSFTTNPRAGDGGIQCVTLVYQLLFYPHPPIEKTNIAGVNQK